MANQGEGHLHLCHGIGPACGAGVLEHSTLPRLQEELGRCGNPLVNSALCLLQNQIVIAAGRSSLGARLSGALHIYNLS